MTTTQKPETAIEMLRQLMPRRGDTTPNDWEGWDFNAPLRISTHDDEIRLYWFTDWRTSVLEWSARFDFDTPAHIVAAAIRESLAGWDSPR
jgi:hypothetical protein